MEHVRLYAKKHGDAGLLDLHRKLWIVTRILRHDEDLSEDDTEP